MNYTKTNWENNKAPAINASHLNNIEDGIYNAHAVLSSLPDSMKFKGTVGVGADIETLPTVASEGDVYMVMTTKTYSPGGVAKKRWFIHIHKFFLEVNTFRRWWSWNSYKYNCRSRIKYHIFFSGFICIFFYLYILRINKKNFI